MQPIEPYNHTKYYNQESISRECSGCPSRIYPGHVYYIWRGKRLCESCKDHTIKYVVRIKLQGKS